MRVIRRAKRNTSYTAEEKKFLLNGICLSPVSTRFGHPIRGPLYVDLIREAWALLEDELRIEWQHDQRFAHYRKRFAEPFAARLLAEQEAP